MKLIELTFKRGNDYIVVRRTRSNSIVIASGGQGTESYDFDASVKFLNTIYCEGNNITDKYLIELQEVTTRKMLEMLIE